MSDRDSCRVDHANNPQHHHNHISKLDPRPRRHPLVVKVGGIDIDQRHACHRSDESDKLVQIPRPENGHAATDGEDPHAKGILNPFGL